MEQIERIRYYEGLLNEATAALKQFETAFDAYAAVQDKIKELEKYYTSDEWKADFAASENNELPADLLCGVLSEDGIDHVLEDNTELYNRARQIRKEFRIK
jgi:hypothetical protein